MSYDYDELSKLRQQVAELEWRLAEHHDALNEAIDQRDKFALNSSWGIVKAAAFYRVADGLTLRGGIFNITDEKYAWWSDVIGVLESAVDHDAYTQPGRNARVSLTYQF